MGSGGCRTRTSEAKVRTLETDRSPLQCHGALPENTEHSGLGLHIPLEEFVRVQVAARRLSAIASLVLVALMVKFGEDAQSAVAAHMVD
eukprot:6467128-Amphidinium_carterae.1